MLNKATLIGNLGKDPEVRRLNDGNPVVNLRVATSETWKDKNSGERKEKTEWHQVVIFNESIAGFAEKYLKKGSKVYIEGQIQTRKWQDQSGNEKYTTEIVLQRFRGELKALSGFGDKDEESRGDAPRSQENGYGRGSPSNVGQGAFHDLDDDIPF